MDFKKGDTIFLFGEVSKIIKASKESRGILYNILLTKSNRLVNIENNALKSLVEGKRKSTTCQVSNIEPTYIGLNERYTLSRTIDYNSRHTWLSTTHFPWNNEYRLYFGNTFTNTNT